MTDENTEVASSATETQTEVLTEPVVTEQATSAATENTASPDPVPYERFSEVIEQKNGYKTQLDELQIQNEALKLVQQQNQQRQPQVTQQDHDNMVEQFGPEGAAAIRADMDKNFIQPQLHQQYANAYKQQYDIGKGKFGEDWSKYDYKDPLTGELKGNKVLDLMSSAPTLTLESAWNATNPVDKAKMEQDMRDKLTAEYNGKAENTAAGASTSTPSATGTGHAMTTEEAYAQAEAELGGG